MHDDPLVALWRDTTRPLNYRVWLVLDDAAQARMRYLVIRELQWLDGDHFPPLGAFHWRHAHRQLLELKAACGHAGTDAPLPQDRG